MGRLEFSEQFKQDAVDLVLRQSYTVTKITRALGIGETARLLSKIGSERDRQNGLCRRAAYRSPCSGLMNLDTRKGAIPSEPNARGNVVPMIFPTYHTEFGVPRRWLNLGRGSSTWTI